MNRREEDAILDGLWFLNACDASNATPGLLGEEGFDLLSLSKAGLKIAPTLVIDAGAFEGYRRTRTFDDRLVPAVLSFASKVSAAELLIRATTPCPIIGLPKPERTEVDRGRVKHLLERCYRSWFDSRVMSYRETRQLSEYETAIVIIVQAVEKIDIHTLPPEIQ